MLFAVALSEREAAFPIARCNRACRTELVLVCLENMDFLLFRAALLDSVGDAIGRKGVSLFPMQFLFSWEYLKKFKKLLSPAKNGVSIQYIVTVGREEF